jgi:hypothetical protein
MPFWLAYSSGDLDDLETFKVDKMAFKGGEILLLSKPGESSPDYGPKVGTEAWEALNRRRAELIDRDLTAKLEGPDLEELELLERLCSAAIDKAFPLPPIDIDSLILLRDSLRADKAANGR